MKYVGSKAKLSKHIVPILQNLINKERIHTYIEPFVGGCNVIDKIQCETRVGSDIHFPLITFYKELQKGFKLPDCVSEEMYNNYKYMWKTKNYRNDEELALLTYIGFNCSFSGKWWGGYARYTDRYGKKQDFVAEANRFIGRQRKSMETIEFYSCNYMELAIKPGSLIYCDPPYSKTLGYKDTGKFNCEEFYDWCRILSKENIVVISELAMPADFKVIWTKERKVQVADTKEAIVEKLFIL